jgi:hypothetical protein
VSILGHTAGIILWPTHVKRTELGPVGIELVVVEVRELLCEPVLARAQGYWAEYALLQSRRGHLRVTGIAYSYSAGVLLTCDLFEGCKGRLAMISLAG